MKRLHLLHPQFALDMPTLTLPDAEIAYETYGNGEPLVLIPGFASGAWSWEWQIDELSEHFRVITFDPRGISRSKITNGAAVTISKLADDVAALLDELKIRSANVLGISFGGFVAQDLAIRHPGRVNRLVLASTSFGGPNHVMPETEVLMALSSTEEMNSASRIRRHIVSAFTEEFASANPGIVDRFCALREANPVPEAVFFSQLNAAMNFDAESHMAMLPIETLVITGDQDKVVPPQNSVNLAAAIPNAQLAVIEGTGHMAFVERAKEFDQLTADFLNGIN